MMSPLRGWEDLLGVRFYNDAAPTALGIQEAAPLGAESLYYKRQNDSQAPSGATSFWYGQHLHANLHPRRVCGGRSAKPYWAGHNDEVQKYITGIVSAQRHKLIAINNMPDHLHLLVGLRPDASLSELVRDIKANSSRFINDKHWVTGQFRWQEGFGAFSYSRSQLSTVIRYIENQQKHHARQSFRDEYSALLEKFGVEYDPRFVFKTVSD
jgi:putative transposase